MVTGMENHRESISSNVFVHFVAGGLAGITAASATYPLDLVRTRLAAQVCSFFIAEALLHALAVYWLFEWMADKSNLLYRYLANAAHYQHRWRYLGALQGTWNNACGIFPQQNNDEQMIINVISFLRFRFGLIQGVGPSIAISFSAYESLRSYWMSNR